jgi:hypothetical protein
MKHLPEYRLMQLAMLGLALGLGLSACLGLSTTQNGSATITINNTFTGLSPTPTAPAYLVGAYVSDSTPTSTSGNIIVYVIFHHGQQPQPGGQVSLYFHYQDGGSVDQLNNQAGTQTTGADGWAKFSIGFGNLPTNTPIGIDVTVHFPGIPDVKEANAASFSVVSLTPTITPSPIATGG